MSFVVEVFEAQSYAREAAARIALDLPGEGAVVLTGGTTARDVLREVAGSDAGWGSLDVFFSDERCVPPDDARSNYGMAARLLLDHVEPRRVHRMRGEDEPHAAARAYSEEITSAERPPFDLVVLGMGADCHIAAMFPGSDALKAPDMCVAVDRPDGLRGLTLTPPALLPSHKVLLIVAGQNKAEAVRRAVAGDEPPDRCPARLLAEHGDATFLLDEPSASLL